MDRKSFIARLIAVPAALLGIKLTSDSPDYRELHSIGEYEELTLAQVRARSSVHKYPVSYNEAYAKGYRIHRRVELTNDGFVIHYKPELISEK